MRTTLRLDDDVAAAAETLRRQEGIGLSEAVNRLARQGMLRSERDRAYRLQAVEMGPARIDVANVAEVLSVLDGT